MPPTLFGKHRQISQRTTIDDCQTKRAYNGAGNMTAKADVKGTTSYTYTSIGQLATVTEPSGRKTTYTYDLAGNRETETATGGRQPATQSVYTVNKTSA